MADRDTQPSSSGTPVPIPAPERASRGFPPRWLLLFFGLLLTAGTLAAISGSQAGNVFQTLIYALFPFLILLPAWMLGVLLTAPFDRRGCFANSPSPPAFRSLVSLGLGIGVFALATVGLGTLHLIEPAGNPWPLVIIPILSVLAGAVHTQRFLVGSPGAGTPFLKIRAHRGDWLFLLAAVPVAILLIAASFPPGFLWRPNGYDVLEYHLQLPREYALLNATAPLHHNVYSFFPSNVEMLYLFLMQMTKGIMGGGDTRDLAYLWGGYPAQFCHAILMLLTAATLALMPFQEKAQDKPFLHSTGRAIATIVFLGIPWTLITGSMAFNEGGMFFFGTLALALAIGGQGEPRWSGLLIGLLLGLAVGCKITAGVFFAIPVALILAVRALKSDPARPRRWLAILIAIAAACLVYSPWAIRAAVNSGGNPVFPIAAGILPRDSWSAQQVERFNAGHSAQASQTTLNQRLRALADNSIFDPDWSVQPYVLLHESDVVTVPLDTWWKKLGLICAAVPLALFCAFISRTGRGQTTLLAAVLFVQVLAWMFVTHLQARFLLPAAIPLAILMGRGVQGLHFAAEGVPASALRILAGTLIGIEAIATGFLLLPEAHLLGGVIDLKAPANHPPDAPPIGEIFGPDVIVNLAEFAAGPDATRAGKPIPPEKSFLLGGATAWTFLGPVDYRTVFDTNPLLDALAANHADVALDFLQKDGVHLLYIDWSELARLEATYHLETGVPYGAAATLPARSAALMTAYTPLLERAGIHDTHGSPVPWATLFRVPAIDPAPTK